MVVQQHSSAELAAPLGIFGGTFDPVHQGHIQPVMAAAQVWQIGSVKLIPCHVPPHKAKASADSAHRGAMLELVSQEYSIFSVDQRELLADTLSYSINTLQSLREEFPLRPLCFFIGADSLLSLPKWYEWQGLFDYCHFVVCQRPGYSIAEGQALDPRLVERISENKTDMTGKLSGHIFITEAPQIDVSSSQIRQAYSQANTHNSLDPDTLIPQVQDYIQQHGLYL